MLKTIEEMKKERQEKHQKRVEKVTAIAEEWANTFFPREDERKIARDTFIKYSLGYITKDECAKFLKPLHLN